MEEILIHRTEFAASTPIAPVREAADPDKIGENRVMEDPNLTPEPGTSTGPVPDGMPSRVQQTWGKARGSVDSPAEEHGREDTGVAQHLRSCISADMDPEAASLVRDAIALIYSRYVPLIINDYRTNACKNLAKKKN